MFVVLYINFHVFVFPVFIIVYQIEVSSLISAGRKVVLVIKEVQPGKEIEGQKLSSG